MSIFDFLADNCIIRCEQDREREKTDPIEVGDDPREYSPDKELDNKI